MKLPNLNPRKTATVLFDEFHSESSSVSRDKAAEMLNSLDKERLDALARFFHGELSLKPPAEAISFAGFGGQRSSEPT